MAASYPTTVRTLTAKIDIQDTILADHVNALQDEVKAIETIVGTSPNVSTYSGTFAQNTTWGTLTERISNLEHSLKLADDRFSNYAKQPSRSQNEIDVIKKELEYIQKEINEIRKTK